MTQTSSNFVPPVALKTALYPNGQTIPIVYYSGTRVNASATVITPFS